jgi:tripartite-type tricarboxylate transporter receptor subunit TctC
VLLSRDIGIEMVHVAYKGSGAYMNDLMGGQVPSAIDTVADLSEQHRAGKIRILATTGASARAGDARRADVHELGLKNMVASGWFGFLRRPTRRRR